MLPSGLYYLISKLEIVGEILVLPTSQGSGSVQCYSNVLENTL